MEILKEGINISDEYFTHDCRACGCKFKFKGDELSGNLFAQHVPSEEGIRVVCPNCRIEQKIKYLYDKSDHAEDVFKSLVEDAK